MKKKGFKNILLKNKVSDRVANLQKVGNPRCFETIKIQNRQLQNIAWHNRRFNQTRVDLFGIKEPLLLENLIQIPNDLDVGVFKCRVIYSKEIEKIEFEKYTPRKVQSLKIVECDDIEYSYKYYDRTKLNELFLKKENCDDILIVKNGLLTDTSFANIVFWDEDKWITPSKPLLQGTARSRLLKTRKIFESEITIVDIRKFKKARIINAMNDLNESINISRIE